MEGKWEEVKRCFSFTFHWPPSWDLPSPPSFSFYLKWWICITWSFLLGRTIFDSNLEKHLFPQPFVVRKEWLFLVDGRVKESRMDVCNSFERMEGVGIMLGAWSFREISQTFSGLVTQLTTVLAIELRIW